MEALRKAADHRADVYPALLQGCEPLRAAIAAPTVAELRLKLPAGAALVEFVRLWPLLGRPGER